MKQFSDKVAVITGAASGIGRGLAKRCAEEKMKVVIADVDENTLIQFQRELNAMGAGVLAVAADVSKQDDVDTLAKRTLAAYGAVHLVFNNAGVYCEDKAVWEYTLADWQWLLSVNFWGVLHGIRTFVPIMLDQDMEGHIVNTSSIAGLASYHGSAIYKVTKHAILSLSETLYHDLAMRNSKIRVSVICPGQVSTNLRDSERLRPSALQNEPSKKTWSNEEEIQYQAWRQGLQGGMSPQQLTGIVFEGIRQNRFYILTHPETKSIIRTRLEDILQERDPTNILA